MKSTRNQLPAVAVCLVGIGWLAWWHVPQSVAPRRPSAKPAVRRGVNEAAGGPQADSRMTRDSARVPSAEALRAMSVADALALLDRLDDASPAALFDAYMQLLEPTLATGSFPLAASLVDTLPRADVRSLLTAAVADLWARTAPADAAGWVAARTASGADSSALASVVAIWASRAPAESCAFAERLPEGSARAQAVAAAVRQWSATDPARAAAWLYACGAGGDHDVAVAALSADPRLVARDPETAMRWATTITGNAARVDALCRVAAVWLGIDAGAARRYLRDSRELTEDERVRIQARCLETGAGGNSS